MTCICIKGDNPMKSRSAFSFGKKSFINLKSSERANMHDNIKVPDLILR
jgi:hypothetical protein